jgi:hypothetical protein
VSSLLITSRFSAHCIPVSQSRHPRLCLRTKARRGCPAQGRGGIVLELHEHARAQSGRSSRQPPHRRPIRGCLSQRSRNRCASTPRREASSAPSSATRQACSAIFPQRNDLPAGLLDHGSPVKSLRCGWHSLGVSSPSAATRRRQALVRLILEFESAFSFLTKLPSRYVAFVAFSDGRLVSTFPEMFWEPGLVAVPNTLIKIA